MLRSDLCDYSDAYIVMKEKITVGGNNANNREDKKLTFKNNVPFKSCISKINNTFIGSAEDLDIVMPMYNLLEYSDNYSTKSGRLCSDEVNNDANENNADNYTKNNKKTTTSKSFEYKTKIIGSTLDGNYILDTEVLVPNVSYIMQNV